MALLHQPGELPPPVQLRDQNNSRPVTLLCCTKIYQAAYYAALLPTFYTVASAKRASGIPCPSVWAVLFHLQLMAASTPTEQTV